MVTESKLSFKIEAIGRIASLKMKGKCIRCVWLNQFYDLLNYLHRFHLMPIANARCRHIKATFPISVIFYLLAEIHELLLTNNKCTIRYEFWKNWFLFRKNNSSFFNLIRLTPFFCISSELYYKDTEITQRQENVNEALKTVCCLLDATPWELGVLSTSKGLIAGPLEIYLPNNVVIDCNIDRNGKEFLGYSRKNII